MKLDKLFVYDIETYPSTFTAYIGNASTRECWGFEISDRKDERQELFSLLRSIVRQKGYLVGFNSMSFDYPVLHKLLQNQEMTVGEIYNYAMEVISADGDDKFKYIVRDKEVLIPQIDLYKVNHFDNKARSTSLKMLEFNMRSDNIEDLPFEPGTVLTHDEIDVLLKYNKHDMSETCKFLMHNLEQLEFREELSKRYKKNMLNFNDTKIGKDLFVTKMEEAQPGSCYRQTPGGGRVMNQTKRKEIALGDCIASYVKFERPEFKAVLEWLKAQVITETKGVFTDIEEHDLGDVAKYAELTTKHKKLKEDEDIDSQIAKFKKLHPLGWHEKRELKSGKTNDYFCWRVADNLNVVVNGLRHDYGVGGLHSSIESTVVRENDEWEIIDIDVAAMYPNIFIANKFRPEHLGENFIDVFKEILNERKKHKKGTALNKAMKLAANGSYGDTNNEYSPLLDAKATMSVTLTGQMSLSMLCEQLLKIDGLWVIAHNTDGTTMMVRRSDRPKVEKIVSQWEKITGLVMEYENYKAMYIRDVNNYIGHYVNDKLKNKGAYEYYLPPEEYEKVKDQPLMGGVSADGMWHKNHSAMVIQKAAEHALVRGGDIEEFILNHEDKYDFMLRTKVPRSSRLVGEVHDENGNIVEEKPLQNICRYYISNDGVSLTKVMPAVPGKPKEVGIYEKEGVRQYASTPAAVKKLERNEWVKVGTTDERRIGINTGWKVKVCNNIKDYDGDINYEWYIDQARKLVTPLLTENND